MTEVAVTLTDGSGSWVTVGLTLFKFSGLKIKSCLREVLGCLRLSDGSSISLIAAEAACFSGVLFALRQCDEKYTVTVNEVSGEIANGDLTACAIASSIGVSQAIGYKQRTPDDAYNGWRIKECTRKGEL